MSADTESEKPQKDNAQTDKEKRLAEALRANLRRRKDQKRDRQSDS